MRSLEKSLPLRLLQAREAVMDMFRPHLYAHGVTEQQWRVLRALAETSGLDAGMLANRVCLLMPSLSRILRDLAAEDLLTRRNNPADRRIAILALTQKGRLLFERMSRESEIIYSALEQSIGTSAYEKMMSDLDHLVSRIDAHRVQFSASVPGDGRQGKAALRIRRANMR